ncbi:MAG: hypothetical protein ACOH2D_04605 [Gelidibacter sp.]
MNEKKHIDRLFQENFKNFEPTPDNAVWDNIQDALHKNKRKRLVIPIWWFTAGVAAILVMLLTIGNVFNNGVKTDNPENSVVDTETTRGGPQSNPTDGFEQKNMNSSDNAIDSSSVIANTEPSDVDAANSIKVHHGKTVNEKDKTASQIVNDDSYKRNTNTANPQDKIASSQKDKTVSSNSKQAVIAQNIPNPPQLDPNKEAQNQGNELVKTILENEKERTTIAKSTDQNIIKYTEKIKDYKDVIASNKEEKSIEDAIAKANLINEEEKEEQPNRWNISPSVAPVYFNSLGKGSSIDNQFVNNGKSGAVNMSYGINGSYAINDKIKIRAGINKVDLGYSTNEVVTFRDINNFNVNSGGSELRNINFNNQGKLNDYMSTSGINKESAPQFVISNAKGSLEQQFGYIEVPLEVEYNIINSKFGLNVIGGFSTLFLNNNEIYSVLDNERALLGDANNINTTSYSANFGLGLNYNISHTLKLNLEPMFKYQINTFNNTSGDFRPYFIGVYSGFSFKF